MNTRIDPIPNARERGAALITVMLVVCWAAVILMGMLSRQALDVQRTENLLDQAQAYAYAQGAEELARQVLAADARALPGVDHPGQAWARLREGVPAERGTLEFTIEDLQGRFNLNALLNRADADATARFQRLASGLGLSGNATSAITQGLEALAIQSLTNSRYVFYVHSVTSARAVGDISPDAYTALKPYIAAFPDLDAQLNVNTASATVLAAFITSDDDYRRLTEAMGKQGYVTLAQLRSLGIDATRLTAGSRYFLLTARAAIGSQVTMLRSTLVRETGEGGAVQIRVINRDISRDF
jgi:general secretion pathway protein K